MVTSLNVNRHLWLEATVLQSTALENKQPNLLKKMNRKSVEKIRWIGVGAAGRSWQQVKSYSFFWLKYSVSKYFRFGSMKKNGILKYYVTYQFLSHLLRVFMGFFYIFIMQETKDEEINKI